MKMVYWLALAAVVVTGGALFVRYGGMGYLAPMPERLAVGTPGSLSPLTYQEAGGEFQGFDIDVVREVGRRLEVPVTVYHVPYRDIHEQLQVGSLHVAVGGMTPSQCCLRTTIVSPEYLSSNAMALVYPVQYSATSLEDFKGTAIAGLEGTGVCDYLTTFPDITCTPVSTYEEGFALLKEGKVAACLCPLFVLQTLSNEEQEELAYTYLAEADENIVMLISRVYPRLAERVCEHIRHMESDGTLDALKQKWGVL